MRYSRSRMDALLEPHAFEWLAGSKTRSSPPHPKTGRMLDEYELTEHYERWHEDSI